MRLHRPARRPIRRRKSEKHHSLKFYPSAKLNIDSTPLHVSLSTWRPVMFFGRFTVLGAAFAMCVMPSATLAAGAAGAAKELGTSVERLKETGFTLAPFASVKFCLANQEQCKDTGGEEMVTLTEDRRQELLSVNTGINRAIKPLSDRANTDTWDVDVNAGDCEDYALTKRKHLLALGWSSRALRITIAKTPSGEGHPVLVVKTTAGDLVLDNRTASIREWSRTDLRWIMMQSGQNPKLWVNLGRSLPQPMFVSD